MLSKPIQDLLEKRKSAILGQTSSETATIHVDEVVSRVAHLYEKLRSLVEYYEEHLIRKMFILRTVRRRLFVAPDKPIAESLIKELIRAGHLPNDTVPEGKTAQIQSVVDNYNRLVTRLEAGNSKRKKDKEWLLDITVSALEECLFPPAKDRQICDLMYFSLKDDLKIIGKEIPADEANLQLFVAVQHSLLRADRGQLQYRLLKLMYPNWNRLEPQELETITKKIPDIRQRLDKVIRNPLAPAFQKLCNHYNTVFFLIGDIAESSDAEKLPEVFSDEDALERAAKAEYEKRYRRERGRLGRMAVLSVISFFLSKIAITLALEIPIERATHTFSIANTAISILFPPILMLLIVATVRMPSSKNFGLIMEEIKNVVYENMPREYPVRILKKNRSLVSMLVNLFYFLMFFVSFALMTKALLLLNFSPANIVIFAFFTSLVAATGVKVHNRSREISMEKERASIGLFVMDLFVMPFVTVGQWAIAGLMRFNVIVLAINLLIELPFQLLMEFMESLRGFIATKKQEIG